MASLASCCTYEHRSSEPPPPPLLPSTAVRERVGRLEELAERLQRIESAQHAPLTRLPDAGFAAAAWSWAAGQDLDVILDEDLTGGDFVRNVRQLIDLLRQLAEVAPQRDTRDAAPARRRGAGARGHRERRQHRMTIRKGQSWGEPGPLAPDAPVADDDIDAAELLQRLWLPSRTVVELGLLGGDLHRTLGAPHHDEDDLRGGTGHALPDGPRHGQHRRRPADGVRRSPGRHPAQERSARGARGPSPS